MGQTIQTKNCFQPSAWNIPEKEASSMLRIPAATYRLQFNQKFRFGDAVKIIGYLADLGITDIYASPYLKAREGSLHGYDIVNHGIFNPEIGTEAEYEELISELKRHEMGQLLDIVPNHMCVASKENIWWMDILENGPSSQFSDFFDIDWEPVKSGLHGKVLLPILGDQYGTVLENQELRLLFEEGAFYIEYYANCFPVRPHTYISILQHRIDELKIRIGEENSGYIEYLSIITALKHLPSYIDTELEKVNERAREKEVAKKRLWSLYCQDNGIKSFIDENISIFNGTRGDPGSFDLLDNLISDQVYRLSYWQVATEEINYRRFFDINSLGAIRVENPAVFNETHGFILKLIREGKVTGLRVDHPDGLYDPSAYFHRLQYNCFKNSMLGIMDRSGNNDSQSQAEHDTLLESEIMDYYRTALTKDPEYKPFYVVGEKILIKSEIMPEEWPITSTTGYVFLNSLNGIFIDTRHAKEFEGIYSRFIKSRMDYQDVVCRNKRLIMETAMASEINMLGHILSRISEKDRRTRDFTLNSLVKVIVEVIASFPVYRTYIAKDTVRSRDRQYIDYAVTKAKKRNPSIGGSVFEFLRDALLLRFSDTMDPAEKREYLDFVMRFQQLTGPIMAKGVEDTSFYVYNRFISLNEVGGMPERFGTSIETFHGQNIERGKFWPHALITSSTHDTKRGEDVRTRINVLSEIPEAWKNHLFLWARTNKSKKKIIEGQPAPDRNEEYYLYQTLIGAWPMGHADDETHRSFNKRIKEHMLKAMREAKINTSWINPSALYEDAVMVFIDTILNRGPHNDFLKDFVPFQKMVSDCGIFNSLSQTLLKMTSPGVPDFYQGTELWSLNLTDPDNRGFVDYTVRTGMLEVMKKAEMENPLLPYLSELVDTKEDGRIKLYLIYKTLNYRRAKKPLFDNGEYVVLEATGKQAGHVCAFARRYRQTTALIVAPRFFTSLTGGTGRFFSGRNMWADTVINEPSGTIGAEYRNIYTSETTAAINHGGVVGFALADIVKDFPVALLEKVSKEKEGIA